MGLSPINIHLQHGHEDYFLGGKGRAFVNIFTEPHAFFLFHPFFFFIEFRSEVQSVPNRLFISRKERKSKSHIMGTKSSTDISFANIGLVHGGFPRFCQPFG